VGASRRYSKEKEFRSIKLKNVIQEVRWKCVGSGESNCNKELKILIQEKLSRIANKIIDSANGFSTDWNMKCLFCDKNGH